MKLPPTVFESRHLKQEFHNCIESIQMSVYTIFHQGQTCRFWDIQNVRLELFRIEGWKKGLETGIFMITRQ